MNFNLFSLHLRRIVLSWYIYFLVFTGSAFAQVWIAGGYNYGQYTYGLRDIQTVFYKYNHTTPDLIEPYKYTDINQGISLNMQIGDETGGGEFGFTSRRSVFTSKSMDNGKEISRFYKCRVSTLNVGLVVFKDFFISPGTTLDFGTYSERKKVATTEQIDTASYQKLFKTPGLILGQTIFTDIQLLGPRSAVNIIVRPYFQYQWNKVMPKFSEDLKIYYRINNFGVSVQLRIKIGN